MKILDGRALADFIKERQAHQVASLAKRPQLLILRDNDSPAIQKYVNLKIQYGKDIGVKVTDFYSQNLDEIRTQIQKAPARDGEPLIGYWIAKPYWNKGICTEALGLMIEHIRCRTDIKSLISGHFVDNPASGRVMEKCGFVPTGETVIDETQYQGKDRPIRVLRLTISA